MGSVQAIWIKRAHRGAMDPSNQATLRAGQGLVGNAERGGRRQVTILDSASWRELTGELGQTLDPSIRRANLLIEGVELQDSRGRVLRVGGCRLRVNGETQPCKRMDEAFQGLMEAMRPGWRGGVYCEALDDGTIAVGDAVAWERDDLEGPTE